MNDLRTSLIRLAHEVPETRKHLLPLIKTAKNWETITVQDKKAGVWVDVMVMFDGSWTASLFRKGERGVVLDRGRGPFSSTKAILPPDAVKAIRQTQKEMIAAHGKTAAGKTYKMDWGGGDVTKTTLEAFVKENEDDKDSIKEVKALAVGQKTVLGGGAGAECTVTRLT